MIPLLSVVAVVILAGAICAELYLLHLYWDVLTKTTNFEKVGPLITALFTPLVSILTIAVSYLVLNRQFHLNEEIEKIKQRLGERYKRESDAYFKIWESVSSAYRRLAALESGQRPTDLRQKIEESFAAAEPYGFVIPSDRERIFFSYWQNARELVAEAEGARTPDDIKAVWARGVRAISDKRSAIRELFRSKYLGDDD